MKEQQPLDSSADVVIIGGGIMGCSTAYHLCKHSDKKVMLLERNKLTSGTTWHSAAQVRQLRSSQNLTRLVQDSVKLYSQLEAETGQATGWVQEGSISIATHRDRLLHIRREAALAQVFGIDVEEISPAEVKSRWPLVNTEDIIGAVYSPLDGRVNPSDVCAALSKSIRRNDGVIREDTAVTGMRRSGRRIMGVETDTGFIECETVVITGGLWSRAIGELAGVSVPLYACEHYYLLTQPIAGIQGHLPTLSDHDGFLYLRDEGGGLLVGCFEPQGKPIDISELPEDFSFGLLNEDWDQFEPAMNNALHRVPELASAEVKMLLNGPESFTPDGTFLLGPTQELDNLFLLCGMNSVGMATGGGAGKALALWIIEGNAPMDLHQADPRRFHALETQIELLRERIPEVLGKHYAIAYPGREWNTGRGLRQGALDAIHAEYGAQWAQRYAWERPLYYAADLANVPCYGKPVWHEVVGEEVAAAHQAAALFDQSSFGKIQVSGPDAKDCLQHMCANNIDRDPGSVIYTAMLNEHGGFTSDLTVLRLAEQQFVMYVNTNAVARDLAWLQTHRSPEHSLQLEDITEQFAVLGLMGPRAAEIMSIAAEIDHPLEGLPRYQFKTITLGGINVRAAHLSYVGQPGWELTVETESAVEVYRLLMDAGKDLGLRPAGALAMTSMRIEKRYLAFGHDITSDETPYEAGLEFAVDSDDDSDFIGANALRKHKGEGIHRHLVSIVLDVNDAWPQGGEPIVVAGEICGQVTSAAFGYRVGHPVCLGYISGVAKAKLEGLGVAVNIAGHLYRGHASLKSAY